MDEDAGRVAGYYSSRACETSRDAAFARGDRRYAVPAVLIARLAVDAEYQGRGVGKALLADALRRIAATSRALGFEVVVVHALHEAAARFYLGYGFQRSRDQPLSLFLTTGDLRATAGSTCLLSAYAPGVYSGRTRRDDRRPACPPNRHRPTGPRA